MKVNVQFRARAAFSLIEVMIAIAIFFGALFVILGLVSGSLSGARHLERPLLDASVVASQLSLTNKLTEGGSSGDLGDLRGCQAKLLGPCPNSVCKTESHTPPMSVESVNYVDELELTGLIQPRQAIRTYHEQIF